jgi:hypothetical protein
MIRKLGIALISAAVAFGVTLHARHFPRNARNTEKRPVAMHGPAPQPSSHLPLLKVKSIVQHGHIVEIEAETESEATVMVNGEKAAAIFGGSSIKHFVGPLPDGINEISITVQNEKGEVNTQKLAVVMP